MTSFMNDPFTLISITILIEWVLRSLVTWSMSLSDSKLLQFLFKRHVLFSTNNPDNFTFVFSLKKLLSVDQQLI